MFKSMTYKEQLLNDQISAEKVKYKQMQDHHAELHFKYVRYQDLVYALMSLIVVILPEMRVLDNESLNLLVKKSRLMNGQLSLDLEKIDDLM